MSEIDRIRNLLKRAYEGEAWHGPSVRQVLDGVSAGEAARRPVAGGHTIWELVLHITAWKEEVARRLQGQAARDLPPSEDWPPVPQTADDSWRDALGGLDAVHRRLEGTVGALEDRDLERPLPDGSGGTWTLYMTLHGVIQHDLYHAGQIALLRKTR